MAEGPSPWGHGIPDLAWAVALGLPSLGTACSLWKGLFWVGGGGRLSDPAGAGIWAGPRRPESCLAGSLGLVAAGTQPLRAHELASTRAAQGGRRGALAHPVCLLARRKPENEAAAGTPVLTCPLRGFSGACRQHGQGAPFSCLAAQVFLLDARDNPGCLTFPKVPREWHGLRLRALLPTLPLCKWDPEPHRKGVLGSRTPSGARERVYVGRWDSGVGASLEASPASLVPRSGSAGPSVQTPEGSAFPPWLQGALSEHHLFKYVINLQPSYV